MKTTRIGFVVGCALMASFACASDPAFEAWEADAYPTYGPGGAPADTPMGEGGAPAESTGEPSASSGGAPARTVAATRSAEAEPPHAGQSVVVVVTGHRGDALARLWVAGEVGQGGALVFRPDAAHYALGEPPSYYAAALRGSMRLDFARGEVSFSLDSDVVTRDELRARQEHVAGGAPLRLREPLMWQRGAPWPEALAVPVVPVVPAKPKRLEPVGGEAPPAGYHVRAEPIWWIFPVGAAAVGLTYGVPLSVALNAEAGDKDQWFAAPIVGPLVVFARWLQETSDDYDTQSSADEEGGYPRWLAGAMIGIPSIALSVLQLGSFGILTAGFIARKPVWVLDDAPPKSDVQVSFTPIVTPRFSGAALSGTF